MAITFACLCCLAWAGLASVLPTRTAAAAVIPAAREVGLPFIRNFSPQEYGGAPQNWSVIQDKQGVIYVGNVSDGLFAFDGSRWSRIPIPNRSAVRSLAMDADGRIYVGAVGDFGYLQADAVGQMHYVSLLGQLPAGQRQFADVWKTLTGKDGVYFTTRAYVFRLSHGKIKAWKADTMFHMAFLVHDTLYIRQFQRGLMRMTDDELVMVSGGERFADEKIYVMLPWTGTDARPNELLIGTRTQGWWRFDGEHYRRWSTEADAAIRDQALYDGIWLSNGDLALAAPPAGILVLDRDGHVVRRLNRSSGLANDAVNALLEDRQHGLWVTSDVGVGRISLNAPITQFDERNGLSGAVMALARHDEKLYAGTADGLFQLDGNQADHPHFIKVASIKGAVWSLLDGEHGLLIGAASGIYWLNGKLIGPLGPNDPLVTTMLRSRSDPTRIFLGTQSGLASLRWDGRGWLDEGAMKGVDDEIRSIVEDEGGQLWLGTWNSTILHATLRKGSPATGKLELANVERYSADRGIPRGEVAVTRIDGELRAETTTGVMAFEAAAQRFVPDPRFAHLFAGNERQLTLVKQDAAGKLWMYVEDIANGTRESGGATSDAQGNWRWQPTPLQPLAGTNMLSILPDSDGVVWFSAEQGLFRYAGTDMSGRDAGFATLLRNVSMKDGTRLASASHPASSARIPFGKNTLRFEFAAPSFDMLGANRFQTQMDGLDNEWSSWSSEAYRDYTNIPDGDYRFLVRAHNGYGGVGKTATFAFRVLPPAYRTWWAWSLWIMLAAVGLMLIVLWRSASLRRRNRTLADLVAQRTSELQAAMLALSEQSITDPLTGLKNRRYLLDHIDRDIAVVERQYSSATAEQAPSEGNTDITFLMVDIDHFKEVNDTYGHAAGDRVLEQMRDILLAAARESDTPIRWGGEEFLIVARFTMPCSGALLAERLRAMVAAHPFELGDGRVIHRTCSIGFAGYPFFAKAPRRLNWEQVVSLADECLYAAKRRGRNAWAGVKAGDTIPDDLSAALSESIRIAPRPGELCVLLSPSASTDEAI
ncbi:diguanylate cyclase [Rhodanobacter umsongensis]|uniref:diguanylate cyclase n=1 Tax=Rhodanobacter umsongensis TaxID=633153 RepID=A0ABW0JH76_9GAMM